MFDVELDPLYVVGESDTLERAVTNLLDNAVKWSPPGGTIRVQLEGDRLRVADQGPGIAEADLPHVFDRFYRADTARNTPGTGLGLSIVAQTDHPARRLGQGRPVGSGRRRVHRPAAGLGQRGGPPPPAEHRQSGLVGEDFGEGTHRRARRSPGWSRGSRG